MELTEQEKRVIFLYSIAEENDISIKSIEQKKNEIKNIINIFSSENPLSIRKRLVLLKLISRSRADENLTYYKKLRNTNDEHLDDDMEKYKVLILAALMYNNIFWVTAANWCGLIQLEVSKRKQNNKERNKDNKSKLEYKKIVMLVFYKNDQDYKKNRGLRPFYFTSRGIKWRIPYREPAKASAAGSDEAIFKEIIITCEGNSGKLRFMKKPQQETYYEFIFDEYQYIIPFELELCFTTVCGKKKKHKIIIPADKGHSKKIKEENKTIIKSDTYYDVDLSGGIEANYEITIKLLNS